MPAVRNACTIENGAASVGLLGADTVPTSITLPAEFQRALALQVDDVADERRQHRSRERQRLAGCTVLAVGETVSAYLTPWNRPPTASRRWRPVGVFFSGVCVNS